MRQHEAIRTVQQDGFGKLENAIGGKIQDQIPQIDGDMRSLVSRRKAARRAPRRGASNWLSSQRAWTKRLGPWTPCSGAK